ncbi:hypothetical protein ACKWRH_08000 [Bradyrhizobium sp. Pa8]|uniref:hypothetical protein n=1 Tax=Bradyrhizobium sp. Pa8 TaxID=3386552 RepID=UPI00403F87DB
MFVKFLTAFETADRDANGDCCITAGSPKPIAIAYKGIVLDRSALTEIIVDALDKNRSLIFSGEEGDEELDEAGMAILSSLRTTFPCAQARQPGYAPMLVRLDAGEGHVREKGQAKNRSCRPAVVTLTAY